MKDFKDGPSDDLSFAEAVFVALDSVETLSHRSESWDEPARVSFEDLYRFATEPSCSMSPKLQRALQGDPRLRADLQHLLDRKLKYRSVCAAAASSGQSTMRQGAGFRIMLRASRADRNQIYVIIRLDTAIDSPPKTLFVIDEECGCQKLPLPAPNAGSVQLLVDSDSALVTALRKPETEVFMQ